MSFVVIEDNNTVANIRHRSKVWENAVRFIASRTLRKILDTKIIADFCALYYLTLKTYFFLNYAKGSGVKKCSRSK